MRIWGKDFADSQKLLRKTYNTGRVPHLPKPIWQGKNRAHGCKNKGQDGRCIPEDKCVRSEGPRAQPTPRPTRL